MIVTVQQASEMLGISPQLLRWRIRRGDLPRAGGRGVMRLHASAVLRYRATMPALRATGRPRALDTLTRKIAGRSGSRLSLLSSGIGRRRSPSIGSTASVIS